MTFKAEYLWARGSAASAACRMSGRVVRCEAQKGHAHVMNQKGVILCLATMLSVAAMSCSCH